MVAGGDDIGTEVGERVGLGPYTIGAPIGAGGMGIVFAGHDPRSGRKVAIKRIHGTAGEARFLREIRALAGLRHPGIVEYVDHGITPDGHAYLVMEWLTGEDLQGRLRRGPLTTGECVALALRLTDALALAHAQGVIHRDIKPSNIFLPGGAAGEAKLLDFGVARVAGEARVVTHTGALVGTLGFMAPEQARGDPDLDGRADLYSLGCVLHECLTGAPLFTGEHAMAVLAKILLADPPRVRSLRPEVPEALDDLVAALLEKDPAVRPRDASTVMARLAALGEPESPGRGTSGVSLRERRVFCLLLLRMRPSAIDPLAATHAEEPAALGELRRIAAAWGAEFSPMLGGFALVSARLDAPASDVAGLVARCALAIRRQRPEISQVLVTGRGERQGAAYVGEVIDRAIALERRARRDGILVDDATAGLLADRFALTRAEGLALLGEEREAAGVRLLLGRPAPFVGRVRELSWLVGLVREALEESRSCAALVTAGPGAGKSRLRHELERTLRSEGLTPCALVGRGAPMTQGAALGVLRLAVRRELEIAEDEPPEAQRARLCRRVAEVLPVSDAPRVAAFLGELCGLAFEPSHHPALPLARRDPIVMADATRVAWVDWLRAECQRRPVLVILEDLHWGDAASVAFVEAALLALADLPLIVVALARPEVHARFPGLWSACRLTSLELPPLSARASEAIVRQVLGPAVGDEVARTLVARAEGNPFFLEELLRAAAQGTGGDLPDSVLGIVQARLQAVDDEARRLLRAASVFGGGFSEAGLAAIVDTSESSLRARLAALVHQELLSREPSGGPVAYRFRHALVRDASYAMLPEDERALAHRLAARWLSGQAGSEPVAVAEHHLRAGQPAEALAWFRRAAEQALEGGDLPAAIERAEQAIACGAEGEALAELRLLQAEARLWAGSIEEAERGALLAVEGLRPGGSRWYTGIQKSLYCASVRGDLDAVLTRLALAERSAPGPDSRWGPLMCLCEAVYAVHVVGDAALMRSLIERIEAQVADAELPPAHLGHVERARATAFLLAGRLDLAGAATARAAAAFTAVGDLRNAGRIGVVEGHCFFVLGAFAAAETALRTTGAIATRLGVAQTLIYSQSTLGEVLLQLGRRAEAREALDGALALCLHRKDPRAEGAIRVALGALDLAEDRLPEAETSLRRGVALLSGQLPLETWGLAALLRVHLARGEREQARELAARVAPAAGAAYNEAFVWLAVVEGLDGEERDQTRALDAALTRLHEQLERIADPELRAALLAIPQWRALLELAAARGRAPPPRA